MRFAARFSASWLWVVLLVGCFERADRLYFETAPVCPIGEKRCRTNLEHCVETPNGARWEVIDDCFAQGLLCAPTLLGCRSCVPDVLSCNGRDVVRCDAEGRERSVVYTCSAEAEGCRDGVCVNLCARAAAQRSNVGCEYWAVDLDNASIDDTSNAAGQQFAVVLSNAEPDLTALVTIEQDDALPGEPTRLVEVARASVPPFSHRVFRLGPREVDGSQPGTFNTGTHTALSRAAYRVRSTVPLVAYQFNPLENVGVFSNDASLLKPVEALTPTGSNLSPAYVVLGWPQTIASTDDPQTNFSTDPSDLRAFITLVGTRRDTRVRVTPTARVLGGGPIAETPIGGKVEAVLQPFDVLNLESDDFNADFTGSLIEADGPVVVYSGSEASDAPWFQTLSRRRCCADHLEEQLDPIRTAGSSFLATISPNRSQAMMQAGAPIGFSDQPEYFRVLAVTDKGARVTTTLPGSEATFTLPRRGSFSELSSSRPFALASDQPVMLAAISPSQAVTNIPSALPGGDPSLLIVPPLEQFRASYVFLTPDSYAFDFVRIIASPEARIVLNGQRLEAIDGCAESAIPVEATTPESNRARALAESWRVVTCQLSFPRFDPNATSNPLQDGDQGDGPQILTADRPVGVLVDGFDAYVSYAYAGGTDLAQIVPE